MTSTGLYGAALMAVCIGAEVARELCFKLAATRSQPERAGYMWRVIGRPLVWAGIALWLLEALAWVAVLGSLPLGVAFPLITLSYAAVPLAGMFLLGERLHRSQVIGAALVVLGVGCIGWGRL